MTNRVLDLSDRPARLSVQNSLLLIHFSDAQANGQPSAATAEPQQKTYRCEQTEKPDEFTIPLADLSVLIASHPQISFSHAVLSGLAGAGGIFVACNEKHMPVAMLLPLASHSLQTERFAAQAALALPVKKRIWQEIVRAKIRAQARLLEQKTGGDHGLSAIAGRVRSGDTGNLEAYAARLYWQKLFAGNGFRRDPDSGGLNACLNYGYAVLRAIVARALCASGLHPSLGVHHHNRYDAFCLADDLMEPFRPIVDREVASLAELPGTDFPLDRESKRLLLEALLDRFTAEEESRTLFDWIGRSADSLAAIIEGRDDRLFLPALEKTARAH